ncbi:hypothetical protein [Ruficoccus sp. ZRK36]|uniref:hypothetical protein n=1 Tax=Ruficoccus sp. ZRK36 TaxID=2866311 RepID=UPI001C737E83|nr:hypothetical protein [Ruficoccus sp. ZRK36]QYY37304.1 hypothetical protein K0V07_07415 [Ruficoccus sp. ZRK36]
MHISKHIFTSVLAWLSLSALAIAADTRLVSVTGMAPGDSADARAIAFADAMREAVRQGAGVDIVSESRVKDFQLESDKILSSAFGYVRDYTVTDSSLNVDGIYRVTLSAEVGRGSPDRHDTMALQNIVRTRGSPRVAVDIIELYEGVPGNPEYAANWLEEQARQSQMNLVQTALAQRQNDRLAAIDAQAGRDSERQLREALLGLDADIVILGKITSRYLGKDDVDGLYTTHRYSVSGELSAVQPDTGLMVARVVIPPRENISSRMSDPESAARDIVGKYLAGGSGNISGQTLFDRILTQWLIESDLGHIQRIEITGINDAALSNLQHELESEDAITGIWVRQFDADGLTILDLETRLDSTNLASRINRASGGTCTRYAGTGNFHQFNFTEPEQEELDEENSSPLSGLSGMSLGGIGLGLAVVAGVVFFLTRKKSST